ncbi:MAG: helix-turn-helix transcriptional regulator [Cyclobacteriaceae bacterium]|nr:helix-turn-helix transcriptional regulator [Cyclobacteriaceae bacterium]
MNYQTFQPQENLSAFVKCYWILEGDSQAISGKQRIVPDGCMEMIFHYGDLYRQYLPNGNSIVQPRCFVFGQISTSLDIEPTGDTGIFSVRFLPDGFTPFSALPLGTMENRAVPLQELFGEEGLELEKKMLQTQTVEERIKILETFLLNRLASPEAADRVVKSSVEVILNLNGNLSVDELSRQVNVNRRQLERKFSSIIGLSPKQLSKMIRLQATLKMLMNGEYTSLTAIAHEGEYYDQAHFIKDFKEFTGLSPRQFYADNLKMSSLFIGTE